jgi:hypothetical protein
MALAGCKRSSLGMDGIKRRVSCRNPSVQTGKDHLERPTTGRKRVQTSAAGHKGRTKVYLLVLQQASPPAVGSRMAEWTCRALCGEMLERLLQACTRYPLGYAKSQAGRLLPSTDSHFTC